MSKSSQDSGKIDARAADNPEDTAMRERLAAKAQWKAEPGHRYTPAQLEKMAQTDLTIERRKRVIMRY